MTKPFHTLQEINQHRYSVLADTGIREYVLCEIANYESVCKWYLVKESLNYELSEDALKFIYESVKLLNNQ